MKNIYSTKSGNLKTIFESADTSQIYIVLSVNYVVVVEVESLIHPSPEDQYLLLSQVAHV